MEVKRGYKQTDVGMIPEEWEVRNLSDVSRKITDGDHVTPIRNSQGYYLLSARNVLNGRIDVSDVDYVGLAEYQRMKQRCGPEAGDILISCSGTIGRIAVVPVGFKCVLVRSAALAKIDPELAVGVFLQFWLQGNKAQWQIASSVNQGAQPNLFLNHIERLVCPLPTLPEQRAIATALSDADAWIESLEQLIAKKRQIKQGAMQELLTGKRRLPRFEVKRGYNLTEIGLIPKDWKLKSLGSIANVTAGGTPSRGIPEYWNGGIPWITTTEVNFGSISESSQHISELGLKDSAARLLSPGTILLALYGQGKTRGKVAILDIEAACNQACAAIVLTDRVSRFFVFVYLTSQYDFIRSLSNTGNQENLNGVIVKSIPIPLPPTIAEQEAIAETLSDMDTEIESLESKLAKAREIKQGMMQELLTGRIRLV